MRDALRFFVAILLALGCAQGLAQLTQGSGAGASNFPNRPVRLIIPFATGGSNDVLARALAHKLTELWGHQVVADNRAGANGVIGIDLTAKAPADGYTLVIVSTSFTMSPSMQKVPFDPVKDFSPIGMVAEGPLILSASAAFPARSVREFVALAKAKPGQLQYASSGYGGVTHLAAELLQKMAGISLVHVPYKGSGAGVIDVIGGQVPLIFSSVGAVYPHLKSGKIRALGIGNLTRSNALPDVPTISESGIPGYESRIWWGIMAPHGTPPNIVNRINRDINRSLEARDMNERITALGMEVVPSTPADFAKQVASDVAKWGKIIRDAGIAEK